MIRDAERISRLQQVLRDESLDAVLCAYPHNVLLATGYWPVVGLSIAIVTREGRVVLIAPEDEEDLAKESWADEVRTFAAASLKELRSSAEAVAPALAQAVKDLALGQGVVLGFENDESSVPAPYAALHVFGARISESIASAAPRAQLRAGSELLRRLRSVLTPGELERVRTACRIGQAAFLAGARIIRPGMHEPEIAGAFRVPLSAFAKQTRQVQRADGWVWCMSGPNSAEAYKAYARTRDRCTRPGDVVMLHCNSYADGFWTDITRTFCFGEPDPEQRTRYEAVCAGVAAAIQEIRPGAKAAAVDQAARETLKARGFEKQFKHPTGHGTGFAAISHNARPRLHPASPDVLETGMVFNVEPAIYEEGRYGIRQCHMVAVTATGAELLTPFQEDPGALIITARPNGK